MWVYLDCYEFCLFDSFDQSFDLVIRWWRVYEAFDQQSFPFWVRSLEDLVEPGQLFCSFSFYVFRMFWLRMSMGFFCLSLERRYLWQVRHWRFYCGFFFLHFWGSRWENTDSLEEKGLWVDFHLSWCLVSICKPSRCQCTMVYRFEILDINLLLTAGISQLSSLAEIIRGIIQWNFTAINKIFQKVHC